MSMTTSAHSIRRNVWAGVAIALILLGSVAAWAVTTEISGAVIAPGTLVVDSNLRKVQHPTGGVIGEIRVRDGSRVKAGDILVRLDETITQANLAIVARTLDELAARKARLEAERDDSSTIRFPDDLAERQGEDDTARIMAGERKLFELRRAARSGQKAQLKQRIAQVEQEVTGLSAQAAAKEQEIALIQKEIAGARELWNKNLYPITRLTQIEREAIRLDGERGQLVASIAQARGRIAEAELQIVQIDQDLASEVAKEIREAEARIGELEERKIAALDQLKRIDIRAPIDGVVHQSTVSTVGGVVTASGEPLMLIVPDTEALIAEVSIAGHDIDRVRLGQTAVVRFSAFNQRTTPEIEGTVSRISADAINDPRTGASYYLARIALPTEEVARLGDVKLLPGMPLEAFIETGNRKVVSYLVKPIYDQMTRAFRER
jgi:HlyD family secretion protein